VPRRLVRAKGHDRRRSLGWLLLAWMEHFVVHGPGDVQGDKVQHGDEYSEFIADCYALDRDGRRLYDSVFLSRPKGCDKSGQGARLGLVEALAPCRFEDWALGGEVYRDLWGLGFEYIYEPGEPMGRPVKVPFIRCMATEETQTGLVYDTIHFNLTEGPLNKVPGLDVGLTRTLLPGGGEITPSTASSASKDGGKETFVDFDETHLYKDPDLRRMYKTVTRNLRKRMKIAETWSLETTTMFAPGEDSVAEGTYRLSEAIAEGRTRRERLFVDHRWGECDDPSDESALRVAITEAYGDAMAWNHLDGLVDEFYDPRADIVDSRRYFLNAETETSDSWLAARQWDTCAAPLTALADRDLVTLGFDGSVSDDATALVACRVLDGHLELLKCEERPEDASAGWQVDQIAIDAAVAAAFERFDVVAFYADPPHWQDYIDKWTTEFGARLRVRSSQKHAIEWWTNRPTAVVAALKRFHDAVAEARVTPGGALESRLTHDGSTQLRRHVLNARRRVSRAGIQIAKEYPGSARKIDAAMASVLAYEARGDAVAAGFARPRRQRKAVGF
jgi:hypothetical protein